LKQRREITVSFSIVANSIVPSRKVTAMFLR